MKKLILGLCIVGLLAACIRNPITGKRQVSLISESQEVAIGEEANREVRDRYGVVENQALQRYIQTVGGRVALQSHRPNLDWHFAVLDSPATNAFALPGGYVYVTRGVLAYLNSEAELAGVIAHEVGHVAARHAARQITNARLARFGMTVGELISPTFGQLASDGDTPLSLLFLRFSRNDERQADRLGVEYSAKAGYDPREIGNFLEVLRRLTDSDDRDAMPSWLSTHPDPTDRVQGVKDQAQQLIEDLKASAAGGLKVNRDVYLRNIDGLVFGVDPRQGFSEGPHFYSPKEQFQITFPLNWQIETNHISTVATDPKGGARVEVKIAAAPAGTTAVELGRQLASRNLFPDHAELTTVNGLPAYAGVYTVRMNGDLLNASVELIEYRQRIYEVAGVTLDPRRYHTQIDQALHSFDRITDDHILHVQPDTLKLYAATEGDTLVSIAGPTNTPLSDADQLAVLNRLAIEQPITPGRLVKTISRGR